jgi:hypothetical protein
MDDPRDDSYVAPSEEVQEVIHTPSAETRLGDVESLIKAVLVIVVVSVGAMFVSMVIGLSAIVLDQLHFNNQIYRDGYSQPVQVKTRTIGQEGIFVNPSK